MYTNIKLFAQTVVDCWFLLPINLVILSPVLYFGGWPVWLWVTTALIFVPLQVFPPLVIVPLVVVGSMAIMGVV